jgi:hypothetical protein
MTISFRYYATSALDAARNRVRLSLLPLPAWRFELYGLSIRSRAAIKPSHHWNSASDFLSLRKRAQIASSLSGSLLMGRHFAAHDGDPRLRSMAFKWKADCIIFFRR